MWNKNVKLLKEHLSAALALALFVLIISITHLSLYNNDYPYYYHEAGNALYFTNESESTKEEAIFKTPEELRHTPALQHRYVPVVIRKQVVESSTIN